MGMGGGAGVLGTTGVWGAEGSMPDHVPAAIHRAACQPPPTSCPVLTLGSKRMAPSCPPCWHLLPSPPVLTLRQFGEEVDGAFPAHNILISQRRQRVQQRRAVARQALHLWGHPGAPRLHCTQSHVLAADRQAEEQVRGASGWVQGRCTSKVSCSRAGGEV